MGFDNLSMLYLLVGIPIFMWLIWVAWSYFRKFEQSARLETFAFGSNAPSWFARIIFGVISIIALSLIVLALAEPYVKTTVEEPKYKNVRLFFLVDVSGSMVYAEDIKPNRMAAVRKEMLLFYDKLDGNYETGIIPFAGSANPYYCPLTYRRSVLIPMTNRLGPDVAPTLGTDISSSFAALEIQVEKDKLDESGVNVVVLITDGGKEEADATNRIKLAGTIEKLASKNTKVYVVGVGGSEPAPLIKRDRNGNFLEYIAEDGKTATSQLDEEILKQIAAQGKGNYLRFEQGDQLYTFLEGVLRENRIADESNLVYKKVTIQHWLFAAAAVLFWLVFIANRSRGVSNGRQQVKPCGSVHS